MTSRGVRVLTAVVACAAAWSPHDAAAQTPLGTGFTYQGRLGDAGNPANGTYDVQLILFDAASAGAQVGPTVTRDDVVVANGLFTVSVDFGAVFGGSKRWLQLGVRPGASTGAFVLLAPRQELTPSPNAVWSASAPWAGVSGKPAGFADGTDDDALGSLACASGQIAKWIDSAWVCAADADTPGWGLTGNAGTDPATHFIGTTNDQAFELRVRGVRALRLEPTPSSPNLVGGSLSNSVLAGSVQGGVIGGGGNSGSPNRVWGMYGTVSGGLGNAADGLGAVVAGGQANRAVGSGSAVAGGFGNRAGGQNGTVVGGAGNVADGAGSLAGGTRAKALFDGTFAWADSQSADFTSTGANQFLIRAAGGVGINTSFPSPGGLTVAAFGKLTFGADTRQMIDLWGPGNYGIGVQTGTTYFRSDFGFAWFQGGTHSDGQNDPGGGIRLMRLHDSGNLYVQGTLNPGGADFAEMLPAEDGLEAGDVLAIGADGQLVLSTRPYQTSLAGVYSTKPGLVGGAADGASTDGKVPLAVAGVVPVKVTDEGGPIVPGDALTSSSTPGHAMKAATVRVGGIAFFPSGVVIGKALRALPDGSGVIDALVVLQ